MPALRSAERGHAAALLAVSEADLMFSADELMQIQRQSVDGPIPCSRCGCTETIEIHDEDGRTEQSITICAGCGSDDG